GQGKDKPDKPDKRNEFLGVGRSQARSQESRLPGWPAVPGMEFHTPESHKRAAVGPGRQSSRTALLSTPRIERLLDQLHRRLATYARSGRDRLDRADIAVIIEVIDQAVADGFHFRNVKNLGFRQRIAA